MARGLKSLVIESDAAEATRLVSILAGLGARSRVAPDLTAGLELLGQQDFDLAVVSMSSPASEGPEFFRTLRDELAREDTAIVLVGPSPAELTLAQMDPLTVLPRPADELRLKRAVQWLSDRSSNAVPFTQRDFQRFTSRLETVSGLVFDAKRRGPLEEALRQRMRLVYSPDFEDYFARLTGSGAAEFEQKRLVHLLTIGETSFFRNAPQFDVLREDLLPRLRHEQDRKGRRIRLWSAGCSTGEECYTMAMIALDIFPDSTRWDLQIEATDINLRSLATARRGVYADRALQAIPGTYQDRYFEKLPDGRLSVSERVRALVRFGELNLQQGRYPASNHVIFCRNVLIYFKRPTVEAVLRKMRDALVPGGAVFLGHSENLLGMEVGLDTVHSRNTYYYVRAEPRAERQPDWWEAEGGDGKAETARESLAPAREKAAPDAGSYRERTGEAEPAKLSTSLPVASKSRSTAGRPPARSEPPASGKPVTEAEREFQALLSRGKDSADALVGEGFLAANRGEAARALRCAQSAVEKAPLLAEAHYLMGVLHADGGEADKAIESFNRALFLQPEFPMAHYHLAHLRAREGRAVEARRSFENAIELLESGIEPHFTGGFSPDQLLMICRQGLAGLGRQGGR